jgi:hypothetical protein
MIFLSYLSYLSDVSIPHTEGEKAPKNGNTRIHFLSVLSEAPDRANACRPGPSTEQVYATNSARSVLVRADGQWPGVDRAQHLPEGCLAEQLLVHRRSRGRVDAKEGLELRGPGGPVSFSRNGTCV